MENFSLFQLLILLFIFYPLIKRIIDGMRGTQGPANDIPEEQVPRHGDQYDPASPGNSRREQSPYQPRGTESRSDEPGTRPATGPSSDPVSSRTKSGEQSWEDFFEGLEEILAGKEPAPPQPERDSADDYRHPSHGPVFDASSESTQSTGGTKSPTTPASPSTPATSDASSHKQEDHTSTGNLGDEVSRELTATENPIYMELDEAPEVSIIGRSGYRNVRQILHDPERIKDGILLKEILDKPRSRRSHQYRF